MANLLEISKLSKISSNLLNCSGNFIGFDVNLVEFGCEVLSDFSGNPKECSGKLTVFAACKQIKNVTG